MLLYYKPFIFQAMKSIILILAISVISASFFTPIYAQYDDVYYDPSKVESKTYTQLERENYNSNVDQNKSSQLEEDYDDQYSELDDQEYYYSSRIRRFHSGYYTRDYYDPFYTNMGFYDPWINDPFLWGNSIIIVNGGWYNPWRARRFNSWGWNNSYWGYWNWYSGYCPNTFAYGYGGWYDPWRYGNRWGGWNDPWCYNPGFNSWGNNGNGWGGGRWRQGDWRDRDDRYTDNPKGTYYGSRNSGGTTTSRSGPVRVRSTEPNADKSFDPNEKTVDQGNDGYSESNGRTSKRDKLTRPLEDTNGNEGSGGTDTEITRRKIRTDEKSGTDVLGNGNDTKSNPTNEDRLIRPRRTIRLNEDSNPSNGNNGVPNNTDKIRRNNRAWPESPQDKTEPNKTVPDRERTIRKTRPNDSGWNDNPSRNDRESDQNSRIERSRPQREPSFRSESPRIESSPRSSGSRDSGGQNNRSSTPSGGGRRNPR